MIASRFIVRTISVVRMPGAETPMNTSAPASTSARLPFRSRGFVIPAISCLAEFICSVLPFQMAPFRSQSVTSTAPAVISSFVMAVAAAPAPLRTMRTSGSFFPTSFSAFVSPARVMTAVPCWSSWKTGISQHSLSRRSISKQRGAEMSSRLMPPKDFEMSRTVLTISSTSLLSMQRGTASTSPKALNRTHLPSITGIPASGPMSPSPRTAVPSVMTATMFQRRVSSKLLEGSFWISRQGAATPGV